MYIATTKSKWFAIFMVTASRKMPSSMAVTKRTILSLLGSFLGYFHDCAKTSTIANVHSQIRLSASSELPESASSGH